MLIEYQAICPHCGQMIFVATSIKDPNEEMLAELAEEQCNCPDARLARGMRNCETRLRSLLGEDSIEKGFEHAISQDTIEGIRQICKMILKEEIDKVSFAERNGDTIRLIRDGNSVKVKRSTKLQMEL